MTTTTLPHAPPRRIGRSIGAIFLGLVAVVALSTGGDMIFHATGVFPPPGEPMPQHELLALALSYRLVFDTLGPYLAARFAPSAPMRHALILGTIGFVLGVLGAVVMWNAGPNWYPIALAATALPCAWVGGRLFERGLA